MEKKQTQNLLDPVKRIAIIVSVKVFECISQSPGFFIVEMN